MPNYFIDKYKWVNNAYLIEYVRLSKADGSQSTDSQRDALLYGVVKEEAIYQDHASENTMFAQVF